MIQKLRLWNAEVFPIPEWRTIAKEGDNIQDDQVYFWYDKDTDLDNIKKWDSITLDEDFLVVEVEE